jgi:transposase
MEYGAIDLHMRRSEIRIEDEHGTVVLARRIDTRREQFARVFADRGPMRILLESSTESEWVACCLEEFGHEVIVADPNYTLMYGQRQRRIKTDQRDVAALATACRTGIFRRATRVSATQRARRQELRVRRHLVQMRTRTINVMRALIRQEGLRLPSGGSEAILARLDRLQVPSGLAAILGPLRAMITALQPTIDALDQRIESMVRQDATAQRLMTAPGVGPIVALTYVATLDTPDRFGNDARRASAYLGLVPREDSSAERCYRGRITKTGPPEVRTLLIQASWTIWRSRSVEAASLRTWVQTLAMRRGRRIAVVALARRLSRILFAMWRDGTVFRTPAALAA